MKLLGTVASVQQVDSKRCGRCSFVTSSLSHGFLLEAFDQVQVVHPYIGSGNYHHHLDLAYVHVYFQEHLRNIQKENGNSNLVHAIYSFVISTISDLISSSVYLFAELNSDNFNFNVVHSTLPLNLH